MIKKDPLDELFLNEETLVYIIDSKQWNKLIEVLKQHKAVIEKLTGKG